jgi:hypothetical protein
MGNSSCRLVLRIDDPQRAHKGGENVSGRVYFNATNKADLSAFQAVNLVLEGHERVMTSFSPSSSGHEGQGVNGSERLLNKRSDKLLVRTEIPIVDFGGRLQPGQYEYPFQWRLPVGLPSSMYWKEKLDEGGHVIGEISYTLFAKVVVALPTKGKGSRAIQDSMTLNMRGNATVLQGQPILMEEEDFPIRTCLFWRNGVIRMGLQATTDICCPGTTLSLNVFGENKSKVGVSYLTVKLVETVNIIAGCDRTEGAIAIKNCFSKSHAKRKVLVESFDCWRALQPRPPNSLLTSEDFAESIRIDLAVPPDVRDSYYGDLIQIRHSIVVTAVTRGLFSTITSPESSYQVRIVSVGNVESVMAPPRCPAPVNHCPRLAQTELLPTDWSPLVADSVVLTEGPYEYVFVDYALGVDIHQQALDAFDTLVPSPPSEGLIDSSDQRPSAPDELLDFPFYSIHASLRALQELVASQPENLVVAVTNDSAWATLVENLSPRDYCSIVNAAGQNAPNVARMLSLTMDTSMTTRHLLACLYTLQDTSLRLQVLKQIAPLAPDLSVNRAMIENELSRDERICLREALGITQNIV